jgi:prepilin-type N-terminal cleavage/methylation domain-containing protein
MEQQMTGRRLAATGGWLRRVRHKSGDRAGFTLVEVIVSIALFAIVMIFVCDTMIFAYNVVAKAKIKSQNSLKAAGDVVSQNDPNNQTQVQNFTITFTAPDGTQTTVVVPGSSIQAQATSGSTGDSVTFHNFVPN